MIKIYSLSSDPAFNSIKKMLDRKCFKGTNLYLINKPVALPIVLHLPH